MYTIGGCVMQNLVSVSKKYAAENVSVVKVIYECLSVVIIYVINPIVIVFSKINTKMTTVLVLWSKRVSHRYALNNRTVRK